MPETLWRVCIDALIADARIVRSGTWLHLPNHRVALSAEEAQLAQRLAPTVAAAGYDPPWVRDLAKTLAVPETRVRQTLRKLSAQGAVHQVVTDLFYDAGRVRELAALVPQLANARGEVEAAAFRDRIGIGRKRAVQILEFFDRVGYTRRVRQAHRLRDGHEHFF
jgi:selenocysteine-specific elongation factor